MVYLDKKLLFSYEEEWRFDFCRNANEFQKYYVKCQELEMRVYIGGFYLY